MVFTVSQAQARFQATILHIKQDIGTVVYINIRRQKNIWIGILKKNVQKREDKIFQYFLIFDKNHG